MWQQPKFKAALDAEWNILRNMPWPDGKDKCTWDETLVDEAADVRKRAEKNDTTVHFTRICELLYEKGSELPEGDPERKAKGRAVILGNNVTDQVFDWAEFQELGSAPPTMEAARCSDALSLLPGYEKTQADAISAYTQAFLKGPLTMVHLPKERWPSE